MRIEDYIFDGIIYKTYSSRDVRNMFCSWKHNLSKEEKIAFENYRKHLFNSNNINAKLRNKSLPHDAVIISNAIKKAVLPKHIIVFRRLDKKENDIISNIQVNNAFHCADFKGTHVGKRIFDFWKTGHYMIILISQNSPVAYINDLTIWFSDEKELLIDKDQSFLLLEKRKLFNRDGYIVKLINDSNITEIQKNEAEEIFK